MQVLWSRWTAAYATRGELYRLYDRKIKKHWSSLEGEGKHEQHANEQQPSKQQAKNSGKPQSSDIHQRRRQIRGPLQPRAGRFTTACSSPEICPANPPHPLLHLASTQYLLQSIPHDALPCQSPSSSPPSHPLAVATHATCHARPHNIQAIRDTLAKNGCVNAAPRRRHERTPGLLSQLCSFRPNFQTLHLQQIRSLNHAKPSH